MPMQNPWRRCSSRTVYQNPWITVREDAVIRPDGQPGIYGVVMARTATGVLAMTEDDEVYLVGQYRYTLDAYSWEIIEGGADPGEDALTAVQRELREEAGLEAAHWEPLGHELWLSNCYTDERAHLFVARGLRQVQAEPEPTEILQVRKAPFDEALRMVITGEIKDAVSVMAILLYARQRPGGAG